MAIEIKEPTGGAMVQNEAPQDIVNKFADINKQIQTTGIQDRTGKTLVAPTTISNTNAIEKTNKNIQNLNDITSGRGITIDANGIKHYADGSIVGTGTQDAWTNPNEAYTNYRNTGGEMTMDEWTNQGRPQGTTTSVADTSVEDKQYQDLLDQMKATSDNATKMLIDNIQQKYAQRKIEQEDVNRRQLKGTKNALLMGGVTGQGSSSQYAPISSGGIISAQESYGIKQLADLDSEEADLIAKAKAAQAENDFKLLDKQLSLIEEKRKEKVEAAKKLNDAIIEENKKIREQNIQSARDSAISDLYSQGITDVASMLNYLNYDEQGNKIGDYTAKEISDTLKNIVPAGLDDLVKSAKNNGAPNSVIQAILNSKNINEAYKNAEDYLQTGTGIVSEYLYYKRQAEANGQVPLDFNAYQNEDANRKIKIASASSASGLPSATLTKVLSVANQFDGEANVKNYNTVQDGYQTIKSIGTDTKNPADDIAFIYAFAKIMDPNSVVREGEYNTVQKYAQSWATSFGFKANRIFSNTNFLSKEAKQNMLNTLGSKVKTAQSQYKNTFDEYGRRINKITGMSDGTDYITDYSKPFSTANDLISSENESKTKVIEYGKTNPNDQKLIIDLTTNNDQDLGRPMTYQEVEQYLKATGKLK